MHSGPPLWLLGLAVAALSTGGCVHRELPDPRAAARSYARAVARRDPAALQAMMTQAARRDHDEAEVRRLLAVGGEELRAQAAAVASSRARVVTQAEIRFDDGERVALEGREGRFWVLSAGGLPARARTPAEALVVFRRAVARRSYAALLRVLTVESRTLLERDMAALVEGLDLAEEVVIDVDGEEATAHLPGGRVVELKREEGVWRVRDFD